MFLLYKHFRQCYPESMPADGPAQPQPLTAEQTVIAERLYRHLQELRRSGVRRVEVDLDDGMGVRPIGRRVDMAGVSKQLGVVC